MYQLTHPNPMVGIFTLGMINRELKDFYKKDNTQLTDCDKDLIEGLAAYKNYTMQIMEIEDTESPKTQLDVNSSNPLIKALAQV